jgi:hypothetical protein
MGKGRAEQEVKEEDEELFPTIPMGVPSSSRPPATVTSTTPNEKRQKTSDPKMGAASFQKLFADTTGHRLDDLINQEVLESANRDEKVLKEEAKDEEPPLFVRGSIKASRLWIGGFSFEGIDVTKQYPRGKDRAVLAVNEDGEDVYLTADDGIALYTKGFVAHCEITVLRRSSVSERRSQE